MTSNASSPATPSGHAANVLAPAHVLDNGVGPVLQTTPLARCMIQAMEEEHGDLFVEDAGAYYRVFAQGVGHLIQPVLHPMRQHGREQGVQGSHAVQIISDPDGTGAAGLTMALRDRDATDLFRDRTQQVTQTIRRLHPRQLQSTLDERVPVEALKFGARVFDRFLDLV